MNSLIMVLTSVLAPVVAGWVVKELALANGKLNALPSWLHQVIAVGVAAGVAALDQRFGLSLPGDLTAWTQDGVGAALMALVAYLTHQSAQLRTKRLSRGLKR